MPAPGLAECGSEVVPAGGVARSVEPASDPTELVDEDRCRMPGNAPLRDLAPVVVGKNRELPAVLVREVLTGVVAVGDMDAEERDVFP